MGNRLHCLIYLLSAGSFIIRVPDPGGHLAFNRLESYFLLGEDRKQSQLIIGVFLSALVVWYGRIYASVHIHFALHSVGKRFEEEQHSNFNWISSFHRLQCDLLARDLFLYMETLFPGIC